MLGGRRVAAFWAVVLAGAVAGHLLVPTYPNYDGYSNLVWGSALAHGLSPDVQEWLAPTPHPLTIALGIPLSAVDFGDRVYIVLGLVLWAVLLVSVARLGAATLGLPAGLVAGALVALSPALLVLVVRAAADVPFLALVAWAAALDAERPGQWRVAVQVLLVLAGLLRPEAWGLALGYAALIAWRSRRVTASLVVLAVVAPVAWFALDWALAGDPLHSLTYTTGLADDLGRSRPAHEAPWLLVRALAHLTTPLGLLLGGIGLVLAVRRMPAERLLMPLALLGAGIAFFLAIVVAGFSAIDRYAWLASLPVFLFAGYALAGFLEVPAGALRTRWTRLSGLAVLVALLGVAVRPPEFGRVDFELVRSPADHEAFVAVLDAPQVREGLRCGPVRVVEYQRVPEVRWTLDRPGQGVLLGEARPEVDRGVFVLPGEVDALRPVAPAYRAYLAGSRTAEVRRGIYQGTIRCSGT